MVSSRFLFLGFFGCLFVCLFVFSQQKYTTGMGGIWNFLMKTLSWEAFLQKQSENKSNILFKEIIPTQQGTAGIKP